MAITLKKDWKSQRSNSAKEKSKITGNIKQRGNKTNSGCGQKFKTSCNTYNDLFSRASNQRGNSYLC